VEAVLTQDVKSERYLVKWEGWVHSWSSWEPAKQFQSQETLIEYHNFDEEWKKQLQTKEAAMAERLGVKFDDNYSVTDFFGHLYVYFSFVTRLQHTFNQKHGFVNQVPDFVTKDEPLKKARLGYILEEYDRGSIVYQLHMSLLLGVPPVPANAWTKDKSRPTKEIFDATVANQIIKEWKKKQQKLYCTDEAHRPAQHDYVGEL
jgi:hypothetical protein